VKNDLELASLVTTDRPVVREDPVYEPAVFDLPVDHELREVLEKAEPVVISGPARMGKRSLLYGLRNTVGRPNWSGFTSRWISPKAEVLDTPAGLMSDLALALDGDPRAITVADLVESSQVIRHSSLRQLHTLILLDLSSIRSHQTLRWIVHSAHSLADEHRDLSRALSVSFVLSGNYELSMFSRGPYSERNLTVLTPRHFRTDELTRVFKRIGSECDNRSKELLWESGVPERIMAATKGDKYYSLLVLKQAMSDSQLDDGPLMYIRTGGIADAIDRVVDGVGANGKRDWIRDRAVTELAVSLSTRVELGRLLKEGAGYWQSIPANIKSHLFDLGVVGPVSSNDTDPAGIGYVDVRNDIVRAWLVQALPQLERDASGPERSVSRGGAVDDVNMGGGDQLGGVVASDLVLGVASQWVPASIAVFAVCLMEFSPPGGLLVGLLASGGLLGAMLLAASSSWKPRGATSLGTAGMAVILWIEVLVILGRAIGGAAR